MAYQMSEAVADRSVLAVLADPTRQTLLHLLRHRPLPVGEIARHLPVSRPAVSQHLKILKEAQLVHERRQGTRHYFSLDPTGFGELRQYVDSMWQDALGAFAAYISEQKKAPRKRETRTRKD